MNMFGNILRLHGAAGFIPAVLSGLMFTACSEWTEPRPLEYPSSEYWEADGWDAHAEAMRSYRETSRNIVYVRLHNSPEGITSEKDFLRSLPDSVDIVSLENADNLSSFDIEDIALVRTLGMKVLYRIDWSGRAQTDFSEDGALEAYLEKAIEAVDRYGMDGWAISGVYAYGDDEAAAAAALMVSTLDEVRTEGRLIVLEGNPLFVENERDRRKLDYVVLDTDTKRTISEVNMAASSAVRAGIRAGRLLLAAQVGGVLLDVNQYEHEALSSVTETILDNSYGGIGIYNIPDDYATADGNYALTRRTISTLNPVPDEVPGVTEDELQE